MAKQPAPPLQPIRQPPPIGAARAWCTTGRCMLTTGWLGRVILLVEEERCRGVKPASSGEAERPIAEVRWRRACRGEIAKPF